MTERTFIHEIENTYDLKSKVKVYPKFFNDRYYKRGWRLILLGVEKILKTYFKRFLKQKIVD